MKKENDINIPLLSVCLITYNHADYIQQAIEGVLMQKTNFEWEFIIADDFSKDGTREILLEYKKKYPGLITLLLQSQNVGGALNWKNLLESANGKYIAYFDGDDYWIDCNKLQKQVDFMEAHLNYSMCFHTVNVKIEIDNLDYSYPTPYKVNLTFKDILFKHYIPTCSLLFRKESLPSPMPDFLFKCIMGDIPLELMLADKGSAFFFNEKMGTYRKHEGGITSNKSQIKNGRKGYIFMYESIMIYFFPRHFWPLLLIIIKTRLGYIKDWFS